METYKQIKYIIKYTERKNSIALVFSGNNIEIRAPKRTSKRVIEKFLNKHHDFILDKLSNNPLFIRKYENGEQLLIGGVNYTLKIILSDFNKIEIENTILKLFITENSQDLKKQLIENYLRKITQIDIERLVLKYSKIMNLYPYTVKLNKAKSRWGSCNYVTKTLNFTIRNAMLEDWVQEYIVIHELAHLKHPNHSASFWNFVAKYMPDYKNAEKYIKLNSQFLVL